MALRRKNRRTARANAYLALPLLREVHDQVVSAQAPGHRERDGGLPSIADEASRLLALADQPLDVLEAAAQRERAFLLHATQQHLEGQSKAPATAQPGDYLHVPGMELAAHLVPPRSIGRVGGIGGTAVWLYGAADSGPGGRALIMLAGPAEFLVKQLAIEAGIKLARLPDRDLMGFPVGLRPGLPIPSTPADLCMLLRALADHEGIPAADDLDTSPEAVAALAQRIGRHLAAGPAEPPSACEVMACVLAREPGSSPFSTILLGVPLWVTSIKPNRKRRG